MMKIGRYTAALILILVGGSLLLDQTLDTQLMVRLLNWWPVILISLGIEYLAFNYWNRSSDKKMKLDILGLLVALIISAIVVSITHGYAIASNWLNFNPLTFSDESGMKFEKETVQIPIGQNTKQLELDNVNGNITIRPGNVEQMEVKWTVYVSKLNQEEAEKIASLSTIEYTEGNTLRVKTKGESYGFFGMKNKPRMDLDITLPNDRELDVVVNLGNGNMDVEDILLRNELEANAINGRIQLRNLSGNMIAESANGSIQANDITGNVKLETINGKITATQIKGNADLETVNGSIRANHIEGDVSANTTAGSVVIESAVLGDWNLATTAGSITIHVPENGDFTVDGSTSIGGLNSEIQLSESRGSIQGTVGTGLHMIEMKTTTGGISIKKLK